MNIDLLSAFLVGLLGSGHCIGMCGGITTMLTAALSKTPKQSQTSLVLNYHIGRLLSYTLIGSLVGFTSSIASKNIGIPLAGLRIVAAVFLILLGLYLGQWLMWLSKVESLGKVLWNRISPISKKLIPVTSNRQAIGLGILWGWLPCGLIYSTLTWALVTGDTLYGGAIMLSFGFGTLPALLAVSFGFKYFNHLINNQLFRKTSAILIILYGFYSLDIAYRLMF